MIDPNGDLVATYRKRATLGLAQTPGDGPCTFDTPFGKVGVMICYDAENQAFVREAMDHDGPVLMINPVHISAGATGGFAEAGDGGHRRWRTSLDAMGRYMEHLLWSESGQGHFPGGPGGSGVRVAVGSRNFPEGDELCS